jgi:hypothetical protein
MAAVIIYNNGGSEILGAVSVRKAITMVYRGVAYIKVEADGSFGPYPVPKSIELIKYIFPKWKYNKRILHYSRKGVLERDGYICAYCFEYANTIDHVIPKCDGGESTWLNTVACCKKCNTKKAGRTPESAGMVLRNKPVQPA